MNTADIGTVATGTVLDRIVARKREEVEALKKRVQDHPLPPRPDEVRPFIRALRRGSGRPIIAEIKKASPSAGILRDPFHPAEIARGYETAGARCMSVITDEKYFQGSLDYLVEARAACFLPALRKDFIIDPIQIEKAYSAGADAILLISRILVTDLYIELYQRARRLGLAILVEVHNAADLENALSVEPVPELIGVNNRDLADFTVSIERTRELLPLMPPGTLVVSESGLDSPETLDRLTADGVGAFLIGTALMKSTDPASALRRLVSG